MAELKDWVNEQKAKGFTDDQLKEHLKKHGYDDAKINEAFAPESPSPQLSAAEQPTPSPAPEPSSSQVSVAEQPNPESASTTVPKKSKAINFIIIGVVALITIGVIFYLNMGITKCPDEACFNEYFQKCEPAVFVKEEASSKARMTIVGGNNEFCNVKTEVLADPNQEIVGMSMVCEIPLQEAAIPDCEGELWDYTLAQMEAVMGDFVENVNEIADTIGEGMPDSNLPGGFPGLDFP